MSVRLEGAGPVSFGPRQSVVLDTGRVWRLNACGPVEALCIPLDPEAIDSELTTTVQGAPTVLTSEDATTRLLHLLLIRTFSALDQNRVGPEESLSIRCHLTRFVAERLALATGVPPVTSHMARMLRRARLLVAHSIAEPGFGAQALARSLGITPRYLAALFQPAGCSPAAYIRKIRLHLAWDLLTQVGEGRALHAIAQDCGYSSPAQFSTAVSQEFGCPPRDIRVAAAEASTTARERRSALSTRKTLASLDDQSANG